MVSLKEKMQWRDILLPAQAAAGHVPLKIGEAGSKRPVALITAGLHGDEGPWGAWAIQKFLSGIESSALTGTIRVVPAANPLALQANLRNAPVDQLDLNRAFPGNAKGSYTEQAAYQITQEAIRGADYVIDLHGGGSWCVNSFVFVMEAGEVLSLNFEAPFAVSAPDRNVTLTGYAREQGAVVSAVEMGGCSQFEAQWAQRIADGLQRSLAKAGVLDDAYYQPLHEQPQPVGETTVLRPARGGIFMPVIRADKIGHIVEEDTILGHLLDPATYDVIETFKAPFEKTALLLLRPHVTHIEGGAMTYVVAEPEQ